MNIKLQTALIAAAMIAAIAALTTSGILFYEAYKDPVEYTASSPEANDIEPSVDEIGNRSENSDSGGSRYMVFDTEMTFEDAEKYCRNIGGHLVSITSESEQKEVERILYENNGSESKDYMIGICKARDNYGTWTTGEKVTYTNWSEIQPDDRGGQNYGVICNGDRPGFKIKKYEWDDNGVAGSKFGFICEWDSQAAYDAYVNSGKFEIYTLSDGVLTLSGRIYEEKWEHPTASDPSGKESAYILKLDSPLNFSLGSGSNARTYRNVTEMQIWDDKLGKKYAGKRVSVIGTISQNAGTIYYRREVIVQPDKIIEEY